MANPTEALDAIEQALQELLLEYGEARHFDSGRTLDEINKERVIKHGFAGLTHLTTLKQQVAELVAFREVSTAKIAQLKRLASHKPGRESSFFRWRAQNPAGVSICADDVIWSDVADLLDLLSHTAAEGGQGGG